MSRITARPGPDRPVAVGGVAAVVLSSYGPGSSHRGPVSDIGHAAATARPGRQVRRRGPRPQRVEGVQGGQVGLGEAQRAGPHVLGEVIEVAGAGTGQNVGAAVQCPRHSDLGGSHSVGMGDGMHRAAVIGARTGRASVTCDRVERYERDTLFTAQAQEFPLLG